MNRPLSFHTLGLVVTVSTFYLGGTSGCAPEPKDSVGDSVGEATGALTVTSNQGGPAEGAVVAVEVRPDGKVVCTKSDGGSWTSANGGHVEFSIQLTDNTWFYAGSQEYPPQPPEGSLYEISLGKSIFDIPALVSDLTPGSAHAAQCTAMPYIDVPGWATCDNHDTPGIVENKPCTMSASYPFSLTAGPPPPGDELVKSNCGGGSGAANGMELCIHNKLRPAKPYRYDFECTKSSYYEVRLHTSSGDTSLEVRDTEGAAYGYSKQSGKNDSVVFKSTSNYNRCFAIVDAKEPSKFMLQIRHRQNAQLEATQLQSHRWTAIVDAGHGKDPNVITSPDPACQVDNPKAAAERRHNKDITAAITKKIGSRYEIIDYDETIRPWAANAEKTTPEEILRRETRLQYGCDGYRGYLMRKWIREAQRDPSTTVALQVHNDTLWPWELGGSSAYFSSSGNFTSGDLGWLESMKSAMIPLLQPWNGERSIDGDHAGFVRGALGYTMRCNQTLMDEHDCAATHHNFDDYGAPLGSVVLLEVAHYDMDNLIYFLEDQPENTFNSDLEFKKAAGNNISFEIDGYLFDHAVKP